MANFISTKLIPASIFAFTVVAVSACFLKPKYHFNDHRGVYKDKGVSKDQLAYLDALERKNHPRRYHRKHVKEHRLQENHSAKKGYDYNFAGLPDTSAKTAITPSPIVQNNNIDTTVGQVQQVPATPAAHDSISSISAITPDVSTNKKSKKKHKRNNQNSEK